MYSILLSVYHGTTLSEAKQSFPSILDEMSSDAEFLVVKDGKISTEVERYVTTLSETNSSVKVIGYANNMGLAYALNFGLLECKYEYVMRMDSDDVVYQGRFKNQIEYMRDNPNISALGMGILEFENSIENVLRYRKPKSGWLRYTLSSPLYHPTVLLRKTDVLDVGGYPSIFMREDVGLWLKLKKNGYKIDVIDSPGVYFRTSESQLSRRLGWKYLQSDFTLFSLRIQCFPYLAPFTLLIYVFVIPLLRLAPIWALKRLRQFFAK